MFEKFKGKGKVTLNKEEFQTFFYTFLNLMSKEWKEIKDKHIEYLQEEVRILTKANQKTTEYRNKMITQNNQLLRAFDLEVTTLRTRILQLENELREATKQ